jgi:type II secretory pathway component PulM
MNWFNNLSYQVRWVLLGSSGLVILMLSYFEWWQPFKANHVQLTHSIATQQQTLQWMTAAAAEIQQLRQQSHQATPQTQSLSLLTLIDKSMRSGALNAVNKRIDSKSDQEVQLHFEAVSFTELMSWLAQLYNQYQIQVDTIHLERLAVPDSVKARLTLKRNN